MANPSSIQRTYKLRIYPNRVQRDALNRWFGTSRWVWNHALERRSKAYKRRGESVTGVDVSRALTQLKKTRRYAWLAATPGTVVSQKLRDQDRAFKNFFAGRAQHPRFRKRRYAQAVRLQLDQRLHRQQQRWAAGQVAVPGLGIIKHRGNNHPNEYPKMATLRRDAAGRYFVTVMLEEARPVATGRRPANDVVGIDLGLTHLAILSTGEKIANPRHLKRAQGRLKKAGRRLSRKTKGSNRWRRQRRRLSRAHARVSDTRADVLHKLTRRLVDENQVLCVESLNVRGLARTKLASSVHDAAWGELLRQLNYKADWAGRKVVALDQWTATTRRCSTCGHQPPKFGLDVRSWECRACGTVHDRDINAAINIRELGIAQLLPQGTAGGATHPSGGDVMRVEGDTHRAADGGQDLVPEHRSAAPAPDETRTGQITADCTEQSDGI